MFKELLILKNIARENAGIIEDLLRENEIPYSVVDLNIPVEIKNLEKYGAVIVLGGPDSANDHTHKMISELTLVRKIVESRIPYLGICLGLQVLVKAMGGSVVKSNVKEVGFRDHEGGLYEIKLKEEGRRDRLFAGLPDTFNVFQLHGETVAITHKMSLLAENKFCKNQIVKVGSCSYGIQCHFEITSEMLEIWLTNDSDLQELDAAKVRTDLNSMIKKYNETGRKLFSNFLNIAGY